MNDNKLIAEFMGYRYDKCVSSEDKSTPLSEQGDYYIPKYNSGDWVSESELEFHKSWDWLMPVVDKIEQVNEGVPEQMLHVNLYSERREVYNAVVEFIKEYNDE